jgi:hypothetical protein
MEFCVDGPQVSHDKVRVYGMQPPELQVSIQNIGNYYRWLVRSSKSYGTDTEKLAKWFSVNVGECQWVDGLGNQVSLGANALTSGELEAFINDNKSSVSLESTIIFAMFKAMINLFKLFGFTLQDQVQIHFPNANPAALHRCECLQQNFVDFSKAITDDILPIPVFSNITPNNTSQFLYHLLLSMGKYDTEMLIHARMRESFVHAKLVMPMT